MQLRTSRFGDIDVPDGSVITFTQPIIGFQEYRRFVLLPGPAEGILPDALSRLPNVVLKTLHINLDELIAHLPGKDQSCVGMPLAEMVRRSGEEGP